MDTIFYPVSANPLGYFRANFRGLPHILGDLTAEGFPLARDWEDLRKDYPEIIGEADQPTAEQVAAWVPEVVEPDPDPPVTDVERLRQGVALYKAANEAAKEIILSLMVMVAGALIALKLFTEENVNDEGAKFVAFHRDALTDFERAGRNRLAAQSLLAAIKAPASVSTFEWLKESAVMAVFESALTY